MLRILFIAYLLTACNGASILGSSALGGSAKSDAKYESANGNETPPTTPDPVEGSASEGAELAIDPVPIGGAYLVCTPNGNAAFEVSCELKSNDGKTLSFDVTSAYTKSGDSWVPIEFQSVDGSKAWWILRLPFEVKGKTFAIILANSGSSIVSGWFVEGEQPLSLVVNGDFQKNSITEENKAQMNYLPPERQEEWKARNADPNSTCTPLFETGRQVAAPSEPGDPDNQWTELDSNCLNDQASNVGNNVVVYQDVKVQAGHVYEFRFSHKARATGATLPQGFRVRINGELLHEQAVTEMVNWTDMQFQVKATTDTIRIEFEETGDPSDGCGTMIDNVALRDFGNGSLKP